MRAFHILALILVTLSIPFVSEEYRFGPFALYDLSILFMAFTIIISPNLFKEIPHTILKRSILLITLIIFIGGMSTLIGVNFYNISISIIDLFRLLAGVVLYIGVWLIINRYKLSIKVIIYPFIVVSIFEIILSIINSGESQRYVGTFGDPNYFATFIAIIFIILLSVVIGDQRKSTIIKNRINKYILLVLVTMLGLSIFLTFSRGSILSLLISLVFLIFNKYKRSFFKIVITITLFCGILSFIYQYAKNSPVYSLWISRFSIENAVEGKGSGRLDIWKEVLNKASENPFGYGWGTETQVLGSYSHNYIGEVLLQFGLIGLFVFLIFHILTIKDIIVLYKHSQEDVYMGIASSLIVLLVSSFFLNVLIFRQFWFFLSIGAVLAHRQQELKRNKVIFEVDKI